MKDFNSYLDNLDYSLVKDLFHEKGKQRIYHKKDFFIRQNVFITIEQPKLIRNIRV